MLAEERRYYDEHLPEWLERIPGRFVLVRGQDLVGQFDTYEEALAEGTRRFGLSPYLVRRVEHHQPEVSAPALTLGLLNADSQHSVRRD